MPRHKNAREGVSFINLAASIAEIYTFDTMCHDFAIMIENRKRERVYMDWAAATPLLPAAKAAMEPFLAEWYGNPSAIHQEGVQARAAVEAARSQIARAIHVRPEFVTFTGSGTEANNLALLGVIESLRQSGESLSEVEVITTRIEHSSIYQAMQRVEQMGVVVRYVDVDAQGCVVLESLRELLSERTRLVACAYVNSEIGSIQPLHAIRKTIRSAENTFDTNIFLHIDAAQAPLWLSCQFDSVGADVVTFDFGKCCGPKGVGALVQSRRVSIAPTTFGGGQESGLRPGTENVAGIVGAAAAFAWAQAGWRERSESVQVIRDAWVRRLSTDIQEAVVNGPTGEGRVANNINISVPGLDTEYAAVVLDSKGFAVSTKSACSGAGGGESTVVREISGDPARAASTLRITLGPDTTSEALTDLGKALKNHIQMMATLENPPSTPD